MDYCTLFFDGCWSKCCARHDKRYSNNRITKHQADVLLKRCVYKKGHKIVANIMFVGVSVFGSYWYYKAQKGKDAY